MQRIAKVIISTLLLSIAITPSLAHAQRMGAMTFGVMAGPQFSTLSEDPEPSQVEYYYKTALLAGAFLGFQVAPQVSIEPQALFSMKGAKVEGRGSQSSLEGKIKINYIAVPVLLKLWFPMMSSQWTPFLFVGPEVAFKVSCKAEGTILAATGERDCSDDTALGDVKSTDFSGTVGGGVKFNAAGQQIILDARYTHGFTNINDTGDNRDIKNRAFAVTIGLGWPLMR